MLSLLADQQLKTLTTAAGVELNRPLVWWSRLAAWHRGYGSRATFYRHDLWTFDLSPFQTIVIFGVDTMVNRISRSFVFKNQVLNPIFNSWAFATNLSEPFPECLSDYITEIEWKDVGYWIHEHGMLICLMYFRRLDYPWTVWDSLFLCSIGDIWVLFSFWVIKPFNNMP